MVRGHPKWISGRLKDVIKIKLKQNKAAIYRMSAIKVIHKMQIKLSSSGQKRSGHRRMILIKCD